MSHFVVFSANSWALLTHRVIHKTQTIKTVTVTVILMHIQPLNFVTV